MSVVQRICNTSYYYLTTTIPILQNMSTSTFLHNRKRIQSNNKPSSTTYEGYLSCGAASYLLNYYLDQYHIQSTMVQSSRNIDHTFLISNEHIIIDPTYKQLFRPNTSHETHGHDEYHTRLYEMHPYIFTGLRDELASLFHEMNTLHKQVYHGDTLDDILDIYTPHSYKDRSSECDLQSVANSLQYATQKGPMYIKLHSFLHHLKFDN